MLGCTCTCEVVSSLYHDLNSTSPLCRDGPQVLRQPPLLHQRAGPGRGRHQGPPADVGRRRPLRNDRQGQTWILPTSKTIFYHS